MKLNKYSWLAVLPMIFTACQDDTLVESQQQDKIYTLSAKMDGGAAMSRAQIVIGNDAEASEGETFMWNEGDSFTLYQGDNDNYTEHVFNIKDYSEEGEGDKKTASFVTNNPALPGEIIAVYPSGLRMVYDQGIMHVEIDFQTELDFSQGTVEEVWKNYFRNNMVMKAKATLSDEGNNSLNFEHLTSLARITYTNHSGKDQQVTDIEFGGDQTFGALMSVWFKYDIIGGGFNNGYKINYKNLIVKDSESFDFYILFGPAGFGSGDMHIHIHTDQTDVNRSPLALPTSTIAAANNDAEGFEAGKRYWFKVTETADGLAWTKDYSTGEDDEVETPTVDTHTATVTDFIGLRDALAVNARSTIIDFGADIELETPLSINCPTTFNMNDHKISLHESNYKTNESDAVFSVSTSFEINKGVLEGKDGEKLHDYYFNLVGTQSRLIFKGTTLNTGSAVINGVFMDDDGIELNENSISSGITTSGNAIHYVANKANPQIWSYINGTINGNVYVETQCETLNAKIIFQSGTINGNLNTNYTGAAVVSDGVLKAKIVSVGTGCTGWDAAGLYVEDQRYYVTTFNELKAALGAEQEADEQTYISFWEDVVMTEPVVINKPVEFHLSEKTLSLSSSFNWGTADAAITNEEGKLTIYGRNNASGIENINGTISGSTTETGKYLIKSSSNDLRLNAVTIAAKDSLNAICVKDNDLYTQGDYATHISAGEGCYAMNMLAETSSANIWLMKETHIVGNVGFTLNSSETSGIVDPSNDRLSTIVGDLIVTGTYASSLRVDVNTSNVTGENWPDNNSGEDGGNTEIDPNASPVGTLAELQESLKTEGSIYLTADIELTSPLVIENIGKPIFMNGKTISMSSSFDWGDADAVITSKSEGLVILGGILKGPETDQTIAKSFFKVMNNGSLQLENGADIRANAIQDAVYVVDARCNVNTKSKISAERYAINMDANTCCDVDIYTGIVDGDIRFALNAKTYGNDSTFCRFGVGPNSQVTGDLIIEGTYKDTATGYYLEKETTANIDGNGWDKATVVTAN